MSEKIFRKNFPEKLTRKNCRITNRKHLSENNFRKKNVRKKLSAKIIVETYVIWKPRSLSKKVSSSEKIETKKNIRKLVRKSLLAIFSEKLTRKNCRITNRKNLSENNFRKKNVRKKLSAKVVVETFVIWKPRSLSKKTPSLEKI